MLVIVTQLIHISSLNCLHFVIGFWSWCKNYEATCWLWRVIADKIVSVKMMSTPTRSRDLLRDDENPFYKVMRLTTRLSESSYKMMRLTARWWELLQDDETYYEIMRTPPTRWWDLLQDYENSCYKMMKLTARWWELLQDGGTCCEMMRTLTRWCGVLRDEGPSRVRGYLFRKFTIFPISLISVQM